MTVPLCIVLPTFFLTCVPRCITSFDFKFSISSTLGYLRLATSDRITLGYWLAITDTLGFDTGLVVSYSWGGCNIFEVC